MEDGMEPMNPPGTAPRCLSPSASIAPASFPMPPGACDTHAHVISPDPALPMVPSRSYTPPPAPEADYLRMLDAVGCSRGVLVQISIYGTDNRYLLEVLGRHPDRLRGVAVVAPDVTDRELEAMHAAGVRGLRINVSFPGSGLGPDDMEPLAGRIALLGWHLQVLVDGRDLPELLPRMRRLPCPGVLDHMGHMPAALGVGHPAFQAMRELVADHGWWAKLSGAYRLSGDYHAFREVTPWARALIAAAPDRVVWGSDWPHVAMARMPDTGLLRNLLAEWAPDAADRERILVHNSARLYGFPQGQETRRTS
jgi:predicted TIM-barrel fold metal-dependent hydrolase